MTRDLQAHLEAAVDLRVNIQWNASVHDPIHKLQMGARQCDHPVPATSHTHTHTLSLIACKIKTDFTINEASVIVRILTLLEQ